MKRLVFDTNVRISALRFGGLPRNVVEICRPPLFQTVVSQPLLDELRRILEVRFGVSADQTGEELRRILAASLLVIPREHVSVCRDPEDDRVLECAIAGKAEVIVTGDLDLLSIKSFRDVEIMTARQLYDSIPIKERESKLR